MAGTPTPTGERAIPPELTYRVPPEYLVNDFLKNISPEQNMNVPIQFTAFVSRENYHEPFSRCHQSIGLTGSQQFGSKMIAVIPLRGDLLGELTLRVTLPPLSPSLGVHWVNGIGYRMLEEIKIRHDETILYQSSGDAQFVIDQATYSRLERIRKDPWETGYRSPVGETEDVSTTLLRKGSPDGILRIPIQWGFGQKGFPALPVASIRDKSLQVEFTLRNIKDLVILDNSEDEFPSMDELPNSLVNANLDMTIYMMELETRENLLSSQNRLLVVKNVYETRETNTMINIEVPEAIKRILITSELGGNCNVEISYQPLILKNIYSENIKWYSLDNPTMYYREYMEIKKNYDSDIPMIVIDFEKGFVNFSRFNEVRLELENLQNYYVVIETMEILQLKQQSIHWMYQ